MTRVTSARDNTNGDGLPRVPSIPLSDERAFDADGDQSIGHLVKDATTHLSTLVRAEIELAKSELAKEIKKALIGSIFFIIALVVFLYSTFFIFFYLADQLTVWLPRPAASAIVLGFMWVIVALFVILGVRKVKKLRGPQRTITTIKDTATALTHRGSDAEPGTELAADRVETVPRRA